MATIRFGLCLLAIAVLLGCGTSVELPSEDEPQVDVEATLGGTPIDPDATLPTSFSILTEPEFALVQTGLAEIFISADLQGYIEWDFTLNGCDEPIDLFFALEIFFWEGTGGDPGPDDEPFYITDLENIHLLKVEILEEDDNETVVRARFNFNSTNLGDQNFTLRTRVNETECYSIVGPDPEAAVEQFDVIGRFD